MEAVRKITEAFRVIIEKAANPLVLQIPDNFKDRKLEIIILLLDDEKASDQYSEIN